MTPRMVLDVLAQAGKLHACEHKRLVQVLVAVLVSVVGELIAQHGELAANILWAPTDPTRAIVLLLTVAGAATYLLRRKRTPATMAVDQ